jgi:hypothetical protein
MSLRQSKSRRRSYMLHNYVLQVIARCLKNDELF